MRIAPSARTALLIAAATLALAACAPRPPDIVDRPPVVGSQPSLVSSQPSLVGSASSAASGQPTSVSGETSATDARPPRRVLFIGNSFTYYNNGIDKELEALSPSIQTESVTEPGYSLQDHWEKGDALRAIRRGGWDYVVLQEHSRTPIDAPRTFSRAFGRFDEEIRRSGATTVLLVRPDPARPDTFNPKLRDEYETVGSRDGVVMARIDRAFVVSLRDRPGLLLAVRGGHPRDRGTYLAACVLYGTVLQSSVVGNAYAPEGFSADHRTYLQQVAAKTSGQ